MFNMAMRTTDGRCVLCGSTERLTAGHVLTAAAESTRFDEMNTFGQCSGCNFAHEHHPEKYHLWYISKFGLPAFESLAIRHWTKHKHTVEELEAIIARYSKPTGVERARA